MNKVIAGLFITCSLVLTVSVAHADRLIIEKAQLSILRVHDVGTGFGPTSDFLDVEVVVRFTGKDGAYGFQLRDDKNRPAREGMLALLRDAFNEGWEVTIVYDIEPPKTNGLISRVWLTKKLNQPNIQGGVINQ